MSEKSANSPRQRDSAEALPKQDLLLKFLRMSTSPNDGEALTAIRKANNLMLSAGWDWEKLLAAKITVVADPFAAISTPPTTTSNHTTQAAPPRSNTPPRKPSPFTSPPPPPPPRPNASWSAVKAQATTPPPQPKPSRPAPQNISLKSNRYDGYCYCCGTLVPAQTGFIFDPSKHNQRATSKWQIICAADNTGVFVPPSPCPRQKVNPNASLNQL